MKRFYANIDKKIKFIKVFSLIFLMWNIMIKDAFGAFLSLCDFIKHIKITQPCFFFMETSNT